MKINNGQTPNSIQLQRFAAKSKKKVIVFSNKAVIYNRCSTEKQDSLDWQEKVCANFCKQNGWDIIRVFSEKESATTDDREQFQLIKPFCQKNGISHIVIFSYDRFSRTGDLSLLKDLRSKGIKVHAATQVIDDQTPSGRFSQSMYLMFAEMENEQRKEKVIEGLRNKLRKGEWIGKPPIGYMKPENVEKPLCFINAKGKLLRQAFYWKDTEKLSNVEVVERLKKMGFLLTLPQLTRIFRNPFYCGYITSTLLDDQEIIRGKHEPLISEEIFLRVNSIVNTVTYGWNVIRENEEMPLKATIRCGKCDRSLTAYPQKGKYIYYKCPNNGCCVNVSNKKLHFLFEAELSKQSFDPILIPSIKTQLESMYWTIHGRDTSREKPMKDELTRLKNELEAMEFNLAIGKISPEIFAKHSVSHEQKIQSIEAELKILVNDSSNLENFVDAAVENAGNLVKMWQNLDYTGKVRLQKLVYPDGILYEPKTHTVRTLSVNPIFSAITSISQILGTKIEAAGVPENEKFHSVYLMFGSSNFLLGNLEKIANELKTLVLGDSYYTSFSGDARCNFISNSTFYHQSMERTFLNLPLMNETGATTNHRKFK